MSEAALIDIPFRDNPLRKLKVYSLIMTFVCLSVCGAFFLALTKNELINYDGSRFFAQEYLTVEEHSLAVSPFEKSSCWSRDKFKNDIFEKVSLQTKLAIPNYKEQLSPSIDSTCIAAQIFNSFLVFTSVFLFLGALSNIVFFFRAKTMLDMRDLDKITYALEESLDTSEKDKFRHYIEPSKKMCTTVITFLILGVLFSWMCVISFVILCVTFPTSLRSDQIAYVSVIGIIIVALNVVQALYYNQMAKYKCGDLHSEAEEYVEEFRSKHLLRQATGRPTSAKDDIRLLLPSCINDAKEAVEADPSFYVNNSNASKKNRKSVYIQRTSFAHHDKPTNHADDRKDDSTLRDPAERKSLAVPSAPITKLLLAEVGSAAYQQDRLTTALNQQLQLKKIKSDTRKDWTRKSRSAVPLNPKNLNSDQSSDNPSYYLNNTYDEQNSTMGRQTNEFNKYENNRMNANNNYTYGLNGTFYDQPYQYGGNGLYQNEPAFNHNYNNQKDVFYNYSTNTYDNKNTNYYNG